jgi:hypothetical protein
MTHPILQPTRRERAVDALTEIGGGLFALYGTLIALAVLVAIVLLAVDLLGPLYAALLGAGYVALLLIRAGRALRD